MGSPSSRSPEDQHQQQHHHHQHTQDHQQSAMIQHRPFDPTTGSSMDPTHPSSSSAAMAPFPYSDPQQPRYDTAPQASQYLPRPPVLRPPTGDNHYMSVAQPFAGSASMAPYGLPAPGGAGGQMFMHGYHTDTHAPAPTPFPSYSTHPYGEPSSFFHSPIPNDAFPSRSAFPAYASHDMNPPYLSTSRGSSRSGLHDAPERPSSLGSLGRSQSYASLQNQPRPASSSASTMSMQPAAGPIRRPATMHGHQPDPRSMSYGSFGGINEYAHLSRNPSGSSSSDSYVHVPISRHRVTTTLWEDEGTLCFQVDANGICVARRHDNNMINGTKLLNVCDLTRGKRDAILKSEKERAVVKVGAMHLKGVWIAFDRAKELARMYNIMDKLYPIFEPDIQSFLYHPDNYSRAGVAEVSRDRQNSRHGKIPELMRSTSEADAARDLKRPSSGVKRNYDSFATPGPVAAPSLARSNTAPALPRAMAPLQRGYSDVQVPGRITTSASPSQQHAEPDRRYDANNFETHGSLALSSLTGTRTSPDAYRRFSPMSNAPLSAPSHISSDHALRRILNVHDNGSPSGTSTPTSAGGMHSGRSGLAAFGMPGESPAEDGREQRDYFPALKRGRHDTATSSGSGGVSEAIEAAREKTYSLSLTGSTRTSPVGQHAPTSTWAAGTSLLSPEAVAGGSTEVSVAGGSGHALDGSSGSGGSSGHNQATLWSLGGEQNKDSASAYAQALLSTPSLQ